MHLPMILLQTINKARLTDTPKFLALGNFNRVGYLLNGWVSPSERWTLALDQIASSDAIACGTRLPTWRFLRAGGGFASAPSVTGSSPRLRVFVYTAAILLGAASLGTAGVLLFVWLGIYNVAATEGHSALTRWFLHFAMRQSVALHASDVPTPGFNDPVLVVRGANYFRRGCAPCHGTPDGPSSPITRGITPPPPPLESVAQKFSPAELHWIVKHGIKMTAMPAWPVGDRDDEIWAVVAFLEAMQALRPADFRRLAPEPESAGAISGESRPDLRVALPVVAQCATCHGVDGNGRGEAFPRLAGLSMTYIEEQLREFRTGARPSGFMRPIAAALTENEIESVAHYYSMQPRASDTDARSDPLRKEGQDIASLGGSHHGPACLTCHAQHDDARNPDIPLLAGQPARYIGEQLLLFKTGIRAQTPNARVMARIAHRLSDDEIAQVALYLATLPAE
jgi:cytochrome c553